VRPGPEDLENYPSRNEPVERGAWRARLPIDKRGVNLLEIFTLHPAVRATAYAVGPNRVRLVRKGGAMVELSQEEGAAGMIAYRTVHGNDPLNWEGSVPEDVLAGRPASPEEWLRWTIRTDYPDLPAQLLAYFRARRAGDLVLFAEDGYDLYNKHDGGHGGLSPGDMHVPLLVAGPDVPVGEAGAARAVDLVPTLLTLLGCEVPPGLDGRSLVAPDGITKATKTD
jgi:hypothetical protein